MVSWRKKTSTVLVVSEEDHSKLKNDMDDVVQRLSDIADRIEEKLTEGESEVAN